jgi:hypothetical protein
MVDLRKKDIQDLQKDIEETIRSLDLPTKISQLKILETDTLQPEFWKKIRKRLRSQCRKLVC